MKNMSTSVVYISGVTFQDPVTILRRTRFEGVLGTFGHALLFERGYTSRFGGDSNS